MSTPFNPNQQPMPGNGPYPTGQQFGAGYGQQPGQQMPGAGSYGQPQGFGQQPQQGYYPQGQFQGAPYGGAPEKKKTGLIVGIIAAVLVVAIIAGIVIWALNKDDSDSVADSPTMPGVPSQGSGPAAGTNPMQPPVGTNPSQGTAPGNGSAGQGDMQQRVASMCKEEINKKFSNANISNENFTQPEVLPNGQKQIYTGIVSGTETSTNKSGRWEFTCNGYYIKDMNDYTGWITYKEA
ncbi:hypothetical protein [Schaalia sp. ORNL0103]|jgi:hypothetical protein|uniref:hypothetical protein n=1 Tax=Schaalia sp. ORNL0103 TaxID=2789426 RepID=UPI001CA4F91E|nr:hypothetical protein [Schaalia sp. ORNL0103]MBW6412785.1 hypothetical protein [Schaalia sp. ORNL0103]